MKITLTEEVELKDVDINISINLKKETFDINLSYTCPNCAGHGCRYSGSKDCNGGTIAMKLDPAKMDKNLDQETASKLRAIIQKLSSSITKHQASDAVVIPFL